MKKQDQASSDVLECLQAIPLLEPRIFPVEWPMARYVSNILPQEILWDFRHLLTSKEVCFHSKNETPDSSDARGLKYTVQYWLQDDESGTGAIHWIWRIKANTWNNTVTFLKEFPTCHSVQDRSRFNQRHHQMHAASVHTVWNQTDLCYAFGTAVYDSLRYTLTGNCPPSYMHGCIPVPTLLPVLPMAPENALEVGSAVTEA
jgi:hypothetical protein